MNQTVPTTETISQYARDWCLAQHYVYDNEFLFALPIIALFLVVGYILIVHREYVATVTEFSKDQLFTFGKNSLFVSGMMLIILMILIILKYPV